jgi:hypothetical protein
MKLKHLLLPSLLFLFSCSEAPESTDSSTSDESSETETVDEVIEDEVEPEVAEFAANEDVSRYNNDAVPSFESYQFKEALEYVFPVEPVFEVNSDYGPENSRATDLFEGTIYEVKISDYTDTDDIVDDEFLHHICHNSEYELLGASNVTNEGFQNANGINGYYSTYTYPMNDQTYSEDLITMGVGKVVIYFKVTSRPNFEAKKKLEYLVNSVKAL